MGPNLKTLLSLSADVERRAPAIDRLLPFGLCPDRRDELVEIYRHRNGFVAFEQALQVFPVGGGSAMLDVLWWNSPDVWRSSYGDMTDGCFFFAQNIFGDQFCIKGDTIHEFNCETGDCEEIATAFETWSRVVLEDYFAVTGYPLAHDWQIRHGNLAFDQRLVPKIPFVMGGTPSVETVYAMDAVRAMRMHGEIAVQIRDLPDGTRVRFVFD